MVHAVYQRCTIYRRGFQGYLSPESTALKADAKVRAAVKDDAGAQLLKTIPGVGDYIALVMSSGIDNVERVANSKRLCACVGIVPSVRASADKIAYYSITHNGSNIMHWPIVQGTLIHVWKYRVRHYQILQEA